MFSRRRSPVAIWLALALLLQPALPARVHAQMPPPPNIQFQESFADLSGWNVTDSEGELAVVDGHLVGGPRTVPAWNDPRLVSKQSYARAPGRALVGTLLARDNAVGGASLRWAADPAADPTADGHGLYAAARTLRVTTPDGSLDTRTLLANTEYIYTIVQRDRGAFYFASTLAGGVYPAWPRAQLVWVDNRGSASPLTPVLTTRDGAFQADDLAVVDLGGAFGTDYGIALAADTFSRDDGPLGAAEVGGAWATGGAPWQVAGGKLTLATGGGAATALLSAAADGTYEVTVHTPASGPVSAGLAFRGRDAANYLFFRLGGGLVQFGRVAGGLETVLAQTGFAVQPDTDYRLVAQAWGERVLLLVDGRQPFGTVLTSAADAGATLAGVFGQGAAWLDGGSTFDDFAAWPAALDLPAAASPGVYGGGRGGVQLAADAFGGAGFAAGWSALAGTWQLDSAAGNVLVAASAPRANVLLSAPAAGANGEFAADILLPGGDPYVLAGLAFRVQDLNNFYFTRFFHIPNDPTIEIELGRYLNGQGQIVRYIPITGEVALGQAARLRAVANGPWITVYLGEVPKIEFYAPELQAAGGAGLYCDPLDAGSRWDNWQALGGGTLAANPTPTPTATPTATATATSTPTVSATPAPFYAPVSVGVVAGTPVNTDPAALGTAGDNSEVRLTAVQSGTIYQCGWYAEVAPTQPRAQVVPIGVTARVRNSVGQTTALGLYNWTTGAYVQFGVTQVVGSSYVTLTGATSDLAFVRNPGGTIRLRVYSQGDSPYDCYGDYVQFAVGLATPTPTATATATSTNTAAATATSTATSTATAASTSVPTATPTPTGPYRTNLSLSLGQSVAAYAKIITYSVQLTNSTLGGQPVGGQFVAITFAGQRIATLTTDGQGNATGTYAIAQPAGSYTMTASFGGTANLLPALASQSLTVVPKPIALKYTGGTVLTSNGANLPLSAGLTEPYDGHYGNKLDTITLEFDLYANPLDALGATAPPTGSVRASVTPTGGPNGAATTSLSLPAPGNYGLALRQVDTAGYYAVASIYPAWVSVLTPQGTSTAGRGTITAPAARAPAAYSLSSGSRITVTNTSSVTVTVSAGTSGTPYASFTHQFSVQDQGGSTYRVQFMSTSLTALAIGCPSAGACARPQTSFTGAAKVEIYNPAGSLVGSASGYTYRLDALPGSPAAYTLTLTDMQGQLYYQIGNISAPVTLATGSLTTQ